MWEFVLASDNPSTPVSSFVDASAMETPSIVVPFWMQIDHDTVKKIAKDDWVKDNGDDVETISYNRFVESMFQLVGSNAASSIGPDTPFVSMEQC